MLVMNKRMADQLLCCMQDDVGEIRLVAADILVNFAPKSLHHYCLDKMASLSSMLLRSVKQQKAELGALFCSCMVNFHLKNENNNLALQLMKEIIKQLEGSRESLERDLLKTARENSPFGKLRALSLMIGETRKVKNFYATAESVELVEAASRIALSFITFFLDNMFSCKNHDGYVGSAVDRSDTTVLIKK